MNNVFHILTQFIISHVNKGLFTLMPTAALFVYFYFDGNHDSNRFTVQKKITIPLVYLTTQSMFQLFASHSLIHQCCSPTEASSLESTQLSFFLFFLKGGNSAHTNNQTVVCSPNCQWLGFTIKDLKFSAPMESKS